MAGLRFVVCFSFFVLWHSVFATDLVESTLPGRCPKVAPLSAFDEGKILGFSLTSHVANFNLSWVRCLRSEIAKQSENLFLRYEWHNASGLVESGNFTLIPQQNSPGLYNLKSNKDDKPVAGFNSIVIEEDFFMLWNCCQQDEETYRESAFIQTPGKRAPEDILKKFQNHLNSYNSSLKVFNEIPELNC